MSNPMARSTPACRAMCASATAPPAGPLSTAFRPRKWSASASAPLDCMMAMALPGSERRSEAT